ncbi:hypothetical protein EI94DRAFT_1700061 [Lactarius quietus]|nr:hypothetical protein EI94DRAFT_1700061 [Lactarius quietus]
MSESLRPQLGDSKNPSESSVQDQRVRTVEEWLTTIKNPAKQCYNCKATDHLVARCPTRHQCKTCGKRHATKACRAIQRSLKEEEALADWVRKPMKEVCWACVDKRHEDWSNDFFDVPTDGHIIVDYEECSHSYFWA